MEVAGVGSGGGTVLVEDPLVVVSGVVVGGMATVVASGAGWIFVAWRSVLSVELEGLVVEVEQVV